jgi:hypothetical protein
MEFKTKMTTDNNNSSNKMMRQSFLIMRWKAMSLIMKSSNSRTISALNTIKMQHTRVSSKNAKGMAKEL